MTFEGYKVTANAIENSETLYDFITDKDLTGIDVFRLFLDWHGAQLCTADFLENTFRVEYGMKKGV